MSVVLVTGGSGTLGTAIQKHIKDYPECIYDTTWVFPTHNRLDILDWESVKKAYSDFRPTVVLHCAAFIGLVSCEADKAFAYQTNVNGTININRLADHFGIHVVNISTDYVFDGVEGNYKENDITNPLSYYAKTKWGAEIAARAANMDIIRTSFCKNDWKPEKAWVDKITSADKVEVIAPMIIKAVMFNQSFGILHIGTETKTFYELAKKINSDVQQSSFKDVNLKIPRDTSFNLTKMKNMFGVK